MAILSLRRSVLLLSCLGLLTLALPAGAAAPTWSPSLLASDPDWMFVFPNDVNEAGKIIGFWQDFDELHAITWPTATSDPVTLAPVSGWTDSWAADVNAKGVVCGTSGMGWPASRGATWDDKGQVTDHQPAGWDYSDMWSINNSGDVVGSVWDAGGWPFWACYWPAQGDPVLLDDGGHASTWAVSVTKDGFVAGAAYPGSGPPYVRACVWDGPDGELVDLHDALEDAAGEALYVSYAYEAMDSGEVAGYAYTLADFRILAWVWSEDEGATILDDGGTGAAFAWQSAGKYLIGGIGGDPGLNGAETSAVWVRGTSKGATTWTLQTVGNLTGYDMIAVGVNTEGDLAGVAQDTTTGKMRGWYAKHNGK